MTLCRALLIFTTKCARRYVGGVRGAVIHPRFEDALYPYARHFFEKSTKNLLGGLVSEKVHGRGVLVPL